MSVINQNVRDLLIKEIVKDSKINQLFDIVFDKEMMSNTSELISFLNKITDELDIKRGMKVRVNGYIIELEKSADEREFFFNKLVSTLIPSAQNAEFTKLDDNLFWTMFAIAEKKCVGNSDKFIDEVDYFVNVLSNTAEQKKAHDKCIDGFNMNSNNFVRKKYPMLKLFLHPLRGKKLKVKQKTIHRVLKKTKRIMQAHEIRQRHEKYKTFSGRCHIVPDEFTKYIVKTYLSE